MSISSQASTWYEVFFRSTLQANFTGKITGKMSHFNRFSVFLSFLIDH